MILYHCTTDKKISRYIASERILAPVRGFNTYEAAVEWNKHTGRNIILKFQTDGEHTYPLPDHKQSSGKAYWTDKDILFNSCAILETRSNIMAKEQNVDCKNADKHGNLCLGYKVSDNESCEQCKNCIKCTAGYYQSGEIPYEIRGLKLQNTSDAFLKELINCIDYVYLKTDGTYSESLDSLVSEKVKYIKSFNI